MFKNQLRHSLKLRLIVSAGLMIILLLPTIGVILSNVFETRLTRSVENELSAYSYSILAVAEVENGYLLMPEQLLENQFNISQSGLYALIKPINTGKENSKHLQEEHALWQSPSLLGVMNIPLLGQPEVGKNSFTTLQFEQQSYFVYSYSVSFNYLISENDSGELPFTVHIIKDKQPLDALVAQFQQQLILWLIILMVALMLIQAIWLKWTLKPLASLKHELAEIEQGKQDALSNSYPIEITPLTTQVNLLLKTEQAQRKRYRNALSDLAHSLKTPLAVIQSQQEDFTGNAEQLHIINQIIEHQLKRAQSAGDSSWHIGVQVAEVIKPLLNSLTKIYHDKAIRFDVQGDDEVIFKGDKADLFEILGNVLDNACKAAKTCVQVSILVDQHKLSFTIADDGAGITEQQAELIMSRGVRADTYQQGHGIGLAIVRDLLASYQGSITIGRSNKLGGAEFFIQFPYQHR